MLFSDYGTLRPKLRQNVQENIVNMKKELIHDISHVTQRLLIFSVRCNPLLRLSFPNFYPLFQFLLESFIQKLMFFFFYLFFILVFSYCLSLEQLWKKRLFSCGSSTSQHFSLPFVHCQEIIAKLLITYPQQAMWMMMAVSKVNIRPALLAVILVCVFLLWFTPSPSFDYAC